MAEPGYGAVHLSEDPRSGPSAVEGTPGDEFYQAALDCDGDVAAGLGLALRLADSSGRPGGGATAELWERLATVAAADPTIARVIEPHLDALAILDEVPGRVDLSGLGVDRSSTWGVFAAEAGGMRLDASPSPSTRDSGAEPDSGWTLTGTKPWCSLGERLSHALVTAHTSDGGRRLFAVALDERVTARPHSWFARGLSAVPSGPLDFDAAPAVAIGDPGWYLDRAGFAWGGIGVASIWWGAAVGIARRLDSAARSKEPDQIALLHLGRADAGLRVARSALRDAASAIDAGPMGTDDARLLAARTRGTVATSAEDVIRIVGHALGPAPLALDDRHAGRVADLELYLRQHHAERDDAAVGRMILNGSPRW